MTRFIEGTQFKGVMFPRFEDRPDGPQTQSFSKCECGAWWKDHRFCDGACPEPPGKQGSEVEIPEELE